MPWKFTFEVDGVPQFNRAFNRISDHVQDLRTVWNYAEDAMVKIEEEQFLTEGAAGLHGRWQVLTPQYAKHKEKRYPGRPILQRSYALVSSLTDKTKDSVRVKEKLEFAFGTSVKSKSGKDYPLMHQRGQGRLPARRAIDLSVSQRTYLQKEIQKGLLQIIRSDSGIGSVVDFK